MFVLVLFAHIAGVLILFAGFGLEWAALHELRRPAAAAGGPTPAPDFARVVPHLHRVAGALILLTGAYMSTELGFWRSGWVPVSLAALVALAAVGMISGGRMRALARATGEGTGARALRDRLGTWLSASFRTRVSAVMGIVYVMVAKPDLVPSLAVIAVAALAGGASTILALRSAAQPVAATDLGDVNGYAAAKRQRA